MLVMMFAGIEYLQFEDLRSWFFRGDDCSPSQIESKLMELVWVKPLKLLDFRGHLDCSEFSVLDIWESDWADLSNNWKKDLKEK